MTLQLLLHILLRVKVYMLNCICTTVVQLNCICTTAVQHKRVKLVPEAVQLWLANLACSLCCAKQRDLCADLRHGQQGICGSHPRHGNSRGAGCLHTLGQQSGVCSPASALFATVHWL